MRERIEEAARQLVRFTQPDLARRLGMRPATVREVVAELEAEGKVFAIHRARNGKAGRPPWVYVWARTFEEASAAPDPREEELPRFEPPRRNGGPVPGTGRRSLPRKDLRDVTAAIRAAGWRLEPCGSGHASVYDARGQFVVSLAASPSDHRADANAMAALRRAGLPV